MKICWINTAVIPYSETKIEYSNAATNDFTNQMISALNKLGHKNKLIAPENSDSKHDIQFIFGDLQPSLGVQLPNEEYLCTQTGSALSKMIDYVWEHQHEFDIIINIGHDWLPYYIMDKFKTPFVNLPNLCETQRPLDEIIRIQAHKLPKQVIFFSQAQRKALGHDFNHIVHQPFDIDLFSTTHEIRKDYLFWAGRIIPEKGLEKALKFAKEVQMPLYVAGPIHDNNHWQEMNNKYQKELKYLGVLDRQTLYNYLNKATAFLQLQQMKGWSEAFGRITVEAMLSGCPVIYHDCGANKELVEVCHGGLELTSESNPHKIISMIKNWNHIQLQQRAKTHFSGDMIAHNFLKIFEEIINDDFGNKTCV